MENLEKFSVLLTAIVALIVLFNQFQLFELTKGGISGGAIGPVTEKSTGGVKLDASNDVVNDVIKTLIPTGIPSDYGPELGISFDDPVAGLSVLARLDRAIATNSLTAEQKARHVSFTTKISCEFCCGVNAVADENGRELCGCSHAAAFRGLSKYLVQNHPEWTDEQIAWELVRWKSMFFPKDMVQKGVALTNNGLALDAKSLNDLDLLSKLQTGNTADIGNLPQMVGGC